MTSSEEVDPFLVSRDAGEEAAAGVIREFLLRAAPPAATFRQRGTGYTLVVPLLAGSRLLTIPASNESDFTFHGNPGSGTSEIADFVANSIAQAFALQGALSSRCPDWRWEPALTSVSPVSQTLHAHSRRLRRELQLVRRKGLDVDVSPTINPSELGEIHASRWGEGNRSRAFFAMLKELLAAGCSEFIAARNEDGTLVAAQLDIIGTHSRHVYYSVRNRGAVAGVGTAMLGVAAERFHSDGRQHSYSFGRGAERYKYAYADTVRYHYELRGFYVPVGRVVTGDSR